MYHLSSEKIVHRDLAARNILLSKDFDSKISDFGMSRTLEDIQDRNTTKSDFGPICWMSPEALYSRTYSEKSDIWAFGVVVYETVINRELYEGMPLPQVAARVGCKELKPNVPDGISILSDLMKHCFEYEPDNRPNFMEVVEILEKLKVDMNDRWVE